MHKGGKALRHQPTQNLTNSNGMVASILLLAGQECGTTEMRSDDRRSSTRSQEIHATSRLMSSLPNNERWTLLLDFTNAFNSISHQAMFAEFRRHLPGLSVWMESCYSGQPLLHLGKDIIHSCCGMQQGDPLGPLGFALTLHPIVKRIDADVSTLALNAWYLDDGTLVGSPGDLSAALHIVESEGPSVGFHLNLSKSLHPQCL